ncbi:MAG: Aminodeoxychorismate lyase [Moorella sp. 60_41]|nr:MAG: Aminodeoxychorismate lyase [Moorella sp. 60_41]
MVGQPPGLLGKMERWRGRRLGIGASLLAAALILALMGSWAWWQSLMAPAGEEGAPPVKVTIPPGATAAEIGRLLEDRGIIRSASAFRFYAARQKADQHLKPGVYLLSPGEPLFRILEQLVAGRVMEEKFTIPEGFTLKQIARLLADKGLVTEDEFWQAAARPYDYPFLEGLSPASNYLEGFLFPDTYRVPAGASAETIIRLMLDRFQQVYSEIEKERAPGLELNTLEIVTLASIVEKEAKLDRERPLIAGVFLNRLRRGMKLESCATVEYLLEEPKPVLTYEDLQIDSPYNTYQVMGLPPGPIASPGRASLLAALNPARTDYLYFAARPDGSHEFSRSWREHLAAVSRYQIRPSR